MNRALAAVSSCLLVALLAACDVESEPRGVPSAPIPDNVPKEPRYARASEVVRALGEAGVKCEVIRSTEHAGSSEADCVATVDGAKVENHISVFDPAVVSEGEIGAAIASRRKPPSAQTLVVAGNWYIRVLAADSAPAIARALDAVVLKGDAPKTPERPLPEIPDKPRYKDVNDLADDLDESVGCTKRKTNAVGAVECLTGQPGMTHCAVLALHETQARRDKVLREAFRHEGAPATLVTAGNWTINLCDTTLGPLVAQDLDGVVVSQDGR
ncbi:hypothetical protein [Streptomyces sp. G45]|uniref:hypothetical protein n=1 Tax=Streptomyces sp. G45 TaxID=3406627 RepID=UPI003C27AC07